ncbi:MAG TPA: serine hydrolase domain-containing protein [Rhizomicrobium sp.]|nr:serine hydrolase domain-containing protein [Rhizomicrobium sp.]
MKTGFLLAALLATGSAFAQPQGPAPAPILAPKTSAAPVAAPAAAAHALTAEDVGAYVDGLVDYGIQRGDIAGAEVVVVKDGQILFEKGYGYADVKSRKPVDPKTTLFRPGSISKLFTWTAVMQLVARHKLDLDADVNTYLDFTIPPAFGKPVTLRDLMTHTPGFEETIRNLGTTDPKAAMPLGAYLKEWVPTRIFPPGEVSAYSNYGAGLAGYIVQRVSGEPFERYVAEHIFAPLGMEHASFAQPLPKALAAGMSKGYELGSGDPKGFEYINVAPAGALAVSGEDIAHFMIAHLNDGAYGNARILDAATARMMHGTAFKPDPLLPGMAYGFYHEDRNGQTVIGHGGDTMYFHSDLHLILGHGVGLYYSQNSAGKPDAQIRRALFQGFMDRYFPAPAAAQPPTLKSAAADARAIAGYYLESRRSASNFLSLGAEISEAKVTVNPDNTISASEVDGLNGAPKKWRETGPQRWREVNGTRMLDGKLENGMVTEITTDQYPPILVFQRASFWQSAAWNVPLMIAMLAMLALTVIFWPIKAVLRWRYKRPLGLAGLSLRAYRWARVAALVDLAAIAAWATLLVLGSMNLSAFGSGSDKLVILCQVLTGLGVILTLAPFWELRMAFADGTRPWWTKATDVLLALACLSFVWFAFSLHFLNFSLNY